MTILELKIEFGEKRGMPTTHFREEYDEIKEYIRAPKLGEDAAYLGLQKVNRRLWDLEGGIRSKTDWKDHPQLAVDKLAEITELNDLRAELVNKLDKTTAKEKLY